MYVSKKLICKDNKKRDLSIQNFWEIGLCRFNRQSYKKETKEIGIKATFAVFGLTNIEYRVIYYKIID